MSIRVGINGFGRIGRSILTAAIGDASIECVAINDLSEAKSLAHLLKYDSVHGAIDATVTASDRSIFLNGSEICIYQIPAPEKIPWKEVKADCVLECTGRFTKRAEAGKHLAEVRKVIISAPAPDADATLVMGVNHTRYDSKKHQIISNGSCTTNAVTPIVYLLDKFLGIRWGAMTTIHSYTNDQRLLDLNHRDLRRARAAAISMIPTTTGAAESIDIVLPHLQGKFTAISIRVPTPNVSLIDLTVEVKKSVTAEEVNELLKDAASGALAGILAYSGEELVSIDYNGNSHSAIVDGALTDVVDGRLVKVFAWYDNETGFSHRMIDLVKWVFR
ncbi:MAG: type I glyceraldehyde-3-phosphate dehydrogenase [Deltaproteobacteria bacterium]|nr:type I glyceraldehyde-3-phosphate dehydrogenase [Deltaproteobacteria bacterium]